MQNFLITRPKKDAAKLAKYLENQGNSVFIESLFDVVEIFPLVEKNEIKAAILTSKNAISAFLSCGFDKNIKIFAIGKKTAEKLLKNGYKNLLFGDEVSALALEKKIIENFDKNSGKILYFHGNFITRNISQNLVNQGFQAESILSYKIIYKDNFSPEFLTKIKNTKFDFVLIYSKNSAKNFKKLIEKHNLVEYFKDSAIIGLSEEITREIKNLGFKNFGNFSKNLLLKNFYKL